MGLRPALESLGSCSGSYFLLGLAGLRLNGWGLGRAGGGGYKFIPFLSVLLPLFEEENRPIFFIANSFRVHNLPKDRVVLVFLGF
jgi:hypothetical protein